MSTYLECRRRRGPARRPNRWAVTRSHPWSAIEWNQKPKSIGEFFLIILYKNQKVPSLSITDYDNQSRGIYPKNTDENWLCFPVCSPNESSFLKLLFRYIGMDLIISAWHTADDGEDGGINRGASDNGDSPLVAVVSLSLRNVGGYIL